MDPEQANPPSIVEPLPEYTRTADCEDSSSKKSLFRGYPKWIYCLLLILAAILGAVLGVVLYNRAQDSIVRDSPDPLITTLTACECEPGTFVFYQTNNSDIFLQGNLRNGVWNNTLYGQIPPILLNLTGHTPPMFGTNMTAVCSSSNSSEVIVVSILSIRKSTPSSNYSFRTYVSFTSLWYPWTSQ